MTGDCASIERRLEQGRPSWGSVGQLSKGISRAEQAKQEKNETNPFVKIECNKMHASKDLCEAFRDGPACETDGFTRSFAGGQSISLTVM
jgi:hypothetical protein